MNLRAVRLPSLVAAAALLLSISSPAAAAPVSFSPPPLEASDLSVQNPWSGLYEWSGSETFDLPEPAPDAYRRFVWKDIETAKDQYDFSKLEQRLVEAKEKGQKFSFRLRAMTSAGLQVPSYIEPYGSYSGGLWYPDWNDAYFLERYRALFAAVGAKYDKDPRLGFIEIGPYGKWGEGHSPGPNPATEATKRDLVDMVYEAFPSQRFISMTDDETMLIHALGKSPAMGIRRDSLGWEHFYETLENKFGDDPAQWQTISERWKTAPVVAEFANYDDSDVSKARDGFFERALVGIGKLHVTMSGNGNMGLTQDELTADEKDLLAQIHWRTGLRPQLVKVELDTQTGPTTMRATWENLGNAPAYEHYDVVWALRDPATKEPMWSTVSSLDLEKLLPTEGTPVVVEDAFTMPTQLAGMALELTVQIVDPEAYRAPLHLVTQGREADGLYPIGTLTLVEGPAGTGGAGPGATSGAGGTGAGGGAGGGDEEGGCACRAGSTSAGSASAALIAMGVGLALRLRRRRG